MPTNPFNITDYAALQAAMSNWALPGGPLEEFEAERGNFIRLAEARFDLELRCHNMIGTSNVTSSSGLISVPSDWLETVDINVFVSGRGWVPISSLTLNLSGARTTTPGRVAGFSMMDGAIRVQPVPNTDTQYELVYYRKLSKLSDTVTSNWILQLHPNLYLFAALANSGAYLRNPEDLAVWAGAATNIIGTINEQTKGAEFARGQPIVRRVTFG